MDYDSSSKFISSLAKFLQSLCNGYVEFDNGVQVIGHLYLSVDTGKTIDYILNEKVCKTDENSVTFISNSFHAQPAEKPKPQSKRGTKPDDAGSDDVDNTLSSNNGSSVQNQGQGSALTGVKRPLSPSQKQSPHSKSGRSSPKYRKESFDQSASHTSNPNSENMSSTPSPAGDGGPQVSTQNMGYSEGYSDNYFNPAEEDNTAEDSEERDVKPSLDTDVTFIKEEYGPNSGREPGGGEQSMFSSNQAFSSVQYSGQFSSSYGGQRSAMNPSGDRSSGMYSSPGSSQLEPGENTGDPSGEYSAYPYVPVAKDSQQAMTSDAFWCPICGKSFATLAGQMKHQRHCCGGNPIMCPECGKTFGRRFNLRVHMRNVHNIGEVIACKECGHVFRSHLSLNKHKQSCCGYTQFSS